MYYIYSITNLITKKQYIGRTKRPKRRFYEHLTKAKSGKLNKFYNAVRKYGEDNFSFAIISVCATESQSKTIEQEYISIYDTVSSGYNTRFGGEGLSKKDLALLWDNPEYRAKQSAAKKKQWNNQEYRERMCKQSKDKADKEFLRTLAVNNWKDPERAKKMSRGRITGRVPVLCLETLKKYNSLSEAEKDTGINKTCITLNITGKMFRAGKKHWIKADKEITPDMAIQIITDLELARKQKLKDIWKSRKDARN